MFLALMNSVDDIIRDRVMLHRERNLDVRLPYYIFAKFGTLALFSAVQCALFVLVGQCDPRDPRHVLGVLFLACSSPRRAAPASACSSPRSCADAKTAANFVPLVLIPQLIFGGALIKYEEMNRDLDLHLHLQALVQHATPTPPTPPSATTPRCASR